MTENNITAIVNYYFCCCVQSLYVFAIIFFMHILYNIICHIMNVCSVCVCVVYCTYCSRDIRDEWVYMGEGERGRRK